MPIETGFILAAGYGTRMGLIGKALPKVLWPIFDTTLLGLQIHFLRELGVKKIYLNAHHQKELIIEYCQNTFPEVVVLTEQVILDAGGGVHNFIEQSKIDKPFIVINSDQYLKTDPKQIALKLSLSENQRAKLFTMNGDAQYSSLIADHNRRLIEIKSNTKGEMFIGLSLIDPRGLVGSTGRSKFFETVCDYKNERVMVDHLEGEFLDFGDYNKYQESCFKLLKHLLENDELLEKWEKLKIIRKDKITKMSYHSDQKNVLNFSKKNLQSDYGQGTIVIKESNLSKARAFASIVFNELTQEINLNQS